MMIEVKRWNYRYFQYNQLYEGRRRKELLELLMVPPVAECSHAMCINSNFELPCQVLSWISYEEAVEEGRGVPGWDRTTTPLQQCRENLILAVQVWSKVFVFITCSCGLAFQRAASGSFFVTVHQHAGATGEAGVAPSSGTRQWTLCCSQFRRFPTPMIITVTLNFDHVYFEDLKSKGFVKVKYYK